MKRKKIVRRKAVLGAVPLALPSKEVDVNSSINIVAEKVETKRRLPFLIPENADKKNSACKYSVITAVYNVELYLNDFFESLINQSVDFHKAIEIILVDDGSIDGSSEIIKEWMSRYPTNIRYVWQENAGQAQARNVGLNYARHEWVTFIDPDDFVALDYFEKIDECIKSASAEKKTLKMVSANLCFYFEELDEFRDSHPLRYRFAKGDIILPATDPGKHIQLSASTAVFKRVRILERSLSFNPEIRPAFEDGHFVNRYLLGLEDGFIAFLSSATYYYRKRGDGSSTLDTAWEKPGRFDAQLRLGYMGLIQESINKYGYVKEFVQRVILYDLSWHFKRFLNNESKLSHLDLRARQRYVELIADIMTYISEKIILDFELAGMWFYHKVGLLSLYKKMDPGFAIVYVDDVDPLKDLVKLRYFTGVSDCSERFSWDGTPTVPVFSTVREHSLYNQIFVYERIIWLRIGDSERLDATISNKADTRISFRGKQHRKGVYAADIRTTFRKALIDESTLPQEVVEIRQAARSTDAMHKYGGCWLLMDRNTQADDNAEHLYRYLRNVHQNIRVFFVLSEMSPDWNRLREEQFNLISFGSLEHKLALLNAAHLISSHADHYIFGDLAKNQYNDMKTYRYTFLQHGVIKDDLSTWLNAKDIDCFVTTTVSEYNSIWMDGPYKFTQKETVLTGLARHDSLRSLGSEVERIILIMPTWRHSLMGPVVGIGNERELNPDFSNTDYAKAWKEILHSTRLKSLCDSFGYKVVFFPHANIQPYLHEFEVPSYIEIGTHHAGESVQAHFARAAVMLTDYSSVAFEMAELDRAVVYYQFDADIMLNGGHIYRPGYYNYERDGFGPVCIDIGDVMDSLESIVGAGGRPNDVYLKRMRDTFVFHDQLNCERTFQAIDALDKGFLDYSVTYPAAIECARRALHQGDWELAIKAWSQALLHQPDSNAEALLGMAKARRMLKEFNIAEEFLLRAKMIEGFAALVAQEEFSLALDSGNYINADKLYNDWAKNVDGGFEVDDNIMAQFAKACRLQNNLIAAMEKVELAIDPKHPAIVREKAELATCTKLWNDAYELWSEVMLSSVSDEALLRLAEACREVGRISDANTYLLKIKSPKNLCGYNLEAAKILFANAKWHEALRLLILEVENHDLSPDLWLMLAKLYRKTGDLQKAKEAFTNASMATDERLLLQERALLHTAHGEWGEAIAAWEAFISRKDLRPNRDALLELSRVRLEMGDFLRAKKDLERFETLYGANKKSGELQKEICKITDSDRDANVIRMVSH